MDFSRFFGSKGSGVADVDGLAARAVAARSDRRSVLRAAGLGMALPAIGGIISTIGAASTSATPRVADLHAEHAMSAAPAAPTGPMPAFQLYDPWLPAVEAGPKDVTIVARDATLLVAKDVAYAAWTFDGTIPGRTIRVVEGDEINFTLKVDPAASTSHSIDFHSAKTAPDKNYKTIMPGEEHTFRFPTKYPGVYMYHCGTPPALMHIGAGMYGAMIVDPKEGWAPAQELVLVQSDLYLDDSGTGIKVPDYTKMVGNGMMDFCVFNGYANQYVENPIEVEIKAPIRMFVLNAGPNAWSSFHVVGTIFDKVYVNGGPKNELTGLQSVTIGPGDGAVVEFTLDEPGQYPFVNHAFGHAGHGAVGVLHAS
jgi:nitrite reductase (NO-forming)